MNDNPLSRDCGKSFINLTVLPASSPLIVAADVSRLHLPSPLHLPPAFRIIMEPTHVGCYGRGGFRTVCQDQGGDFCSYRLLLRLIRPRKTATLRSRPTARMESGLVFNVQRYSLHDGPGIRTTIFLKGCPLCCQWCHNPESIAPRREIVIVDSRCVVCGECRSACPLASAMDGAGPLPPRTTGCTQCGACIDACPTGARQVIGRSVPITEIMHEVMRDRVFYEDSGGGVTISGGEPLSQPRFLIGLLQECKNQGIHAALDTTGFGQRDALLAAANLARLVLYDLKAFDEALHVKLTGVSNRIILSNLRELDREHPDVWIRLPVVPGFNDNLEDLRKIAEFVSTLRSVTLVNLLPFHRTGLHKFERLGLTHSLDGVETPSGETMQAIVDQFHAFGLKTRVGG